MIIYNVTVSIDASAHDDWLDWMKTKHIPDVMETGCFIDNKICKVLSHDQEGSFSYAIQYSCKDMATLDGYQKEHAQRLQADHTSRYEGRYAAFRTLLEVVHSI